jgi:HicA toxin of bacterial toxin-antitoxin,
LLNFLADCFRCDVRQGKGSEVTVYRPGGRTFTLGHHGTNDEVSTVMVKRLLKRLGIDVEEWLQAVYE